MSEHSKIRYGFDETMPKGKSLGLVAMGESKTTFMSRVMHNNGSKPHDHVWACNLAATLLHPDLYDTIWMMDDAVEHNFPWLENLYKTNKPIFTSTAYPDLYDNFVEYPLNDVKEFVKNEPRPDCTTAYAFVYALMCGDYDEIYLYGTDFVFPALPDIFWQRMDEIGGECFVRGHSCMNYWTGKAVGAGINVIVPEQSGLLYYDNNKPWYGYRKDNPDGNE